jgi:adenosylcobinamide-GDP ribazoletransferase
MTRPLEVAAERSQVGGRSIGPVDVLGAALGVLTRLPVAAPAAATGAAAFAIVGVGLGAVAAVPLMTLGPFMPVAAAILAVAVLAVVSGGLHLDGLADTFDALVAMGPDAAERARRDPAVGAAGAAALILVLGLDVALLAGPLLESGHMVVAAACVIAGAVSRSMPPILAWVARSQTRDEGLAAWFTRRIRRRDLAFVFATVILAVAAASLVASRSELALGGAVGLVASVAIGRWLVRLRRQLDGDLFGASIELAFAVTLLAIAVPLALARAAS